MLKFDYPWYVSKVGIFGNDFEVICPPFVDKFYVMWNSFVNEGKSWFFLR